MNRPPMTDEQKEACYVALDKISTAHRPPQPLFQVTGQEMALLQWAWRKINDEARTLDRTMYIGRANERYEDADVMAGLIERCVVRNR